MSTLRLFLLGLAQLIYDDQAVELTTAKAVALLAYLATTGTSQTRDHLTDLLWPESLPDAARKNLRNTLWTIHKALGNDVWWSVCATEPIGNDQRYGVRVGREQELASE